MEIEVTKDKNAVGSRAADLVCNAIAANPRAILGLPTGATPIPMYDDLNRRAEAGSCDFDGASIYAIDEFCDAGRTTPGTNSVFYREHLRFKPRALHCPNPSAQEPELHIRAFADAIHRAGGIDLCVLGIGATGHIAFNEPGAERDSRARVVTLTEVSRRAHAAAFGSLEAVPSRAMTLGIADLLASRSIVVLATGSAKAAIVRDAIEGPPTADVPASWLQVHTDVRWLLDADAASLLS